MTQREVYLARNHLHCSCAVSRQGFWQLLLSGEAADESKSCQKPPCGVLPDHLQGRLPQGLLCQEVLSLLLCGQQARLSATFALLHFCFRGKQLTKAKVAKTLLSGSSRTIFTGGSRKVCFAAFAGVTAFTSRRPTLQGAVEAPPVPSCARRMQARAGFQTQLLSAPRCLSSKAPANMGDR